MAHRASKECCPNSSRPPPPRRRHPPKPRPNQRRRSWRTRPPRHPLRAALVTHRTANDFSRPPPPRRRHRQTPRPNQLRTSWHPRPPRHPQRRAERGSHRAASISTLRGCSASVAPLTPKTPPTPPDGFPPPGGQIQPVPGPPRLSGPPRPLAIRRPSGPPRPLLRHTSGPPRNWSPRVHKTGAVLCTPPTQFPGIGKQSPLLRHSSGPPRLHDCRNPTLRSRLASRSA